MVFLSLLNRSVVVRIFWLRPAVRRTAKPEGTQTALYLHGYLPGRVDNLAHSRLVP
jgi:hypothetical protein